MKSIIGCINIYRGQIDDNSNLNRDFNDLNDPNSAGKPPENCRKTAGKLPANQQEQKIYKYILKNESITTAKVMELLGVKQRRAREILSKMIECGWLTKEGVSRRTIYIKNTEGR
jgi:predicted HTH transcriptional regulator